MLLFFKSTLVFTYFLGSYGAVNCSNIIIRLIEKIEFLYSNIIRDWDGAMEIFLPIENITKEIFS